MIEGNRGSPELASAYYSRAMVHKDQGHLNQAITDFTKAIQLDPTHVVAYLDCASVYAEQSQIDQAQKIIDQLLAIDFSKGMNTFNMPSRYYVAWFLVTCSEPRLRRIDRAIELATEATQTAPMMGDAWVALGAAQYRRGNWEAARDALAKSAEFSGHLQIAGQFFQAMAHWQLGEKDKARRWYHKAVEEMEEKQPENKKLRRICAEAAELLEVIEPSPQDDGPDGPGQQKPNGVESDEPGTKTDPLPSNSNEKPWATRVPTLYASVATRHCRPAAA